MTTPTTDRNLIAMLACQTMTTQQPNHATLEQHVAAAIMLVAEVDRQLAPPTLGPEPTLAAVLEANNLMSSPGNYGKRHITDAEGNGVFYGTAGDVWDWLREIGLYKRPVTSDHDSTLTP